MKQTKICFIFLSLAFTGCTSVRYQSETPAGPARPANYPIPVYTELQKIPRPCEIIGTVSINAGRFTMFGGSAEKETVQVMQLAHEKGADAVKLISMDKPEFTNPNYRMRADLLRYSEPWEKVAVTAKAFESYLDANRNNLDPIEGIWFSDDIGPHTVGVMRDDSKPGREFIGFILESQNPVWPQRSKKMDIRRGQQSGSYIVTYYLDDFSPRQIPLVLGNKTSFELTIWKTDETGAVITYIKGR